MADERRVWDRFAPTYDLVVRLYDRSYPSVRERLAEDLAGRHHVLELGAGTGQFTADIAAVVDELVATDISPKMVQRLEAVLPSNVQVRVMSAYDIDAADGQFDAVFCANALHVMETPEVALRECLRVLKDDGLLIIPTFLHGVSPGRRSLSRLLSLISPFVAHTRFNLVGLEKLVIDAGFDIVRSEQLSGVFPIGYVAARPRG